MWLKAQKCLTLSQINLNHYLVQGHVKVFNRNTRMRSVSSFANLVDKIIVEAQSNKPPLSNPKSLECDLESNQYLVIAESVIEIVDSKVVSGEITSKDMLKYLTKQKNYTINLNQSLLFEFCECLTHNLRNGIALKYRPISLS